MAAILDHPKVRDVLGRKIRGCLGEHVRLEPKYLPAHNALGGPPAPQRARRWSHLEWWPLITSLRGPAPVQDEPMRARMKAIERTCRGTLRAAARTRPGCEIQLLAR